jgi:GT2 family glycosyltransferase
VSESVAVVIVTHQAAEDVTDCLASVAALRPPPREIVVVDCASADATVERTRRAAARFFDTTGLRLVPLAENRGYAGGLNVGIAACDAPWVLSLNADAQPDPGFVASLLAGATSSARIAAVTGRLVRPPSEPPRLDACGMRLVPSWRHLDRGSGEIDRGQFAHAAAVFGATGAASLFRRRALEDVAIDGQIFDEDFHSFREDAELCFRLQERGWQVLYEPRARCVHRRSNTPGRRRSMPASVNRRSLRNRYLLRAYHQTPRNLLVTLLPATLRELGIVLWVLVRERTSVGAYAWLWRNRRRIWRRRRLIQSRRTVPAAALDAWFFRDERPL